MFGSWKPNIFLKINGILRLTGWNYLTTIQLQAVWAAYLLSPSRIRIAVSSLLVSSPQITLSFFAWMRFRIFNSSVSSLISLSLSCKKRETLKFLKKLIQRYRHCNISGEMGRRGEIVQYPTREVGEEMIVLTQFSPRWKGRNIIGLWGVSFGGGNPWGVLRVLREWT